jgi:spermidine/putrescine transport system ATP-binding protein
MQIELKRIQTEVRITFVHVTHDQEEAMTMADTIAVMNAGVVEQMGRPAELYEHPRTTFVANFLGQSNLLEGEARSAGHDIEVDVQGTRLRAVPERSSVTSGRVRLGVRPEKVSLVDPSAPADGQLNRLGGGVVTDVSFVGVSTQYLVRMPWGQELMVFEQNTGQRPSYARGASVDLGWRPEHAFLLDASQDAKAGADLDGA